MKNNGFTLIESLVVVVVVSILATIATISYYGRIVKAQASEAISSLEAEKIQVFKDIARFGGCTENKAARAVDLKYGKLSVGGTVISVAIKGSGASLKTGCTLTYTFNTTNVSKQLAGKKITVDLFNNSVLSKSNSTNVDQKYLPPSLTPLTEDPLPESSVSTGNPELAKDTETPVGPAPADDSTPSTPNGTYHHKSNLPEFVLGAKATKKITIYPAGVVSSTSDYDGASSGITGLYFSNGATFDYGCCIGGNIDGIMSLKGASAVFGNLGYNNYDRNWGTGGQSGVGTNGYWDWGTLTGKGTLLVGKSATYNGVKLDVLSVEQVSNLYQYLSETSAPSKATVVSVRITNTTDIHKVLYTMFGEQATAPDYYSHGERGGTLAHGVGDSKYVNRAFQKNVTQGGKVYAVDGYMVVED